MKKVICQYCGSVAELVDSKKVYGTSYGMIYICKNYPKCNAFVGSHKKTNEPLGTLARPELREIRILTHAHFDLIWKGKFLTRREAYKQLAKRMNIKFSQCHIGMFDKFQCLFAIKIAKAIMLERGSKNVKNN